MAPTLNKKQAIVSAKDLNLFLRIFKANWWVPLIILPIFYAAGTFYVYRLTNVYKASTEFLLKSNDTYYQKNVLNESNFYAYGSYVDNLNEIRILQSYDLSKEVVDKLWDRLEVSYYIVGKVRTTEQFTGMPFKVTVNKIRSDHYEKMFDFHIIDENNFELAFEDNGERKVISGKFGEELINLDLLIKIDRLDFFASRKAEDFTDLFYQFSIHSKNHLINNIRSHLKAENLQYTNILKLELTDILPERAVLILDTLNHVYSMNKLQSRFELNDRTIEYIDIQLDQITYSLKGFEDTMQNYKTRRSIIDLEWERNDFLGKISQFDNQKAQLNLQLSALDDLEKYIIEDKDPQFLPPNVFIVEKAGFMIQAVQDLYTKQIELNKLYAAVREMNPHVYELKSSIKKTKQDLLVYINNTRKATQQQIQNVNKEIGNYIGEAKQIPSKQRDLLNIERKANVSEKLYNFLLEKKASTKIAKASIVPDIKIVEAPRNAGIDSPDKPKIQKQFLSIGLLISLIIIAIRLFFYTRIKTVDHLKELTTLPLIGVLPYLKNNEKEGIVVDQSPNSLIAESFRNFRTNLQYANIDTNAKTFLVTSFLPGEGKTFTCVNLATILAKSGKRTLILELDLHKPRVYRRFGLPDQQKGITTFITGNNTAEEIITPVSIPNLFCAFSGPIPPNPSEFILSEKMKELLDFAKQNFDYVIIDTPPAGLLSDSVYLIQYTDATIFVLNTKSTTKKVINFVEELVANNNLKNVNLLLNGVKNIGKRYYYQGYGYSYGYGYGYGYGKGYSRS